MDFSKKPVAVFYIEKNSAFFYGSNISVILKLDFPQDVFSDLEILDKEKLSGFLQAFIESNGILPANVMMLLSDQVTFEKDFLKAPFEQVIEKQIQDFLDFVPFESVWSETLKLGKKIKIVAVNREFCDLVKGVFEKQKFSIIGIVPVSVLQETIPEFSNSTDLQLALSKIDFIKQYSLLKVEDAPDKIGSKKEVNNKRLIMLLGIFGFLFIILAILVFTQR